MLEPENNQSNETANTVDTGAAEQIQQSADATDNGNGASTGAPEGGTVDTENTESVSTTLEAGEGSSETTEGEQTSNEPDGTGTTKTVKFSDFQKLNGEVGTQQPPPAKPQKFPAGARDYSGIAEEHKKLFKGMGNAEFNFAKQKYIENAELQKQIAELKAKPQQQTVQVYDHPEGYMLTPEYKTQSARSQVATNVKRHYMTQLAKAQRGERWTNVELDGQGNLKQVNEEQEPTPENIVQLTEWVTTLTQQEWDEKQKLNQLVQGSQTGYKSAVSKIDEAIQQYYKPLLDLKPEDPLKKLQDNATNLVPEQFRGHPMTKLFVLTLAENARINGQFKALQQELATLKQNKVDATKAQPTKAQFVSGKGGAKAPISFSRLKELAPS
jgi:hypothetical protein